MRWLHLAVVAVFAIAVIIFAFQNLEVVRITFLGFSGGAPLALWAVLIYILGMATGGSLWSLLRRSIEGSRRPAAPSH